MLSEKLVFQEAFTQSRQNLICSGQLLFRMVDHFELKHTRFCVTGDGRSSFSVAPVFAAPCA